ncbi:GDSL-type esterase/lipase family protein [Paenibacillus sp. FSL M8-0334]|uniref:Lysophospholipase n=1 Tax=Paenibacillus campinasensis TaxID=66347 RepID=A0ABW9SZV9_9BACL|nr:GDSL-type esterase/lipase family protein [Paenibacillus campinasensis]MUG65983.1 lysophospholipase [Paenibacillus campinasensis]
MKSTAWIWRIAATASIVATVLLIAGFVYAFRDINYPQGQVITEQPGETEIESVPPATADPQGLPALPETIKVAAIGDSLTRGTGDAGGGYVRRTIDLLNAEGRETELLNNLAVNGQTTEQLLPKLGERGVRYSLEQADLILLTIGGNDLFQGSGLLSSVNSGAAELELDPELLMEALPQATERLQRILGTLREINPHARIVYVGLYHPFADLPELLIPGNIVVSAWNQAAMEMISRDANMTLVPTFDLFQHKLDVYLSSDHFHPNGEGYQAIAERIVKGLL